jgi:hypothetical protein
MLFLPPLPPVWVPKTRELVLGRSSKCDLTIVAPGVSRRHAVVGLHGYDVEVRDTGSTNGTYVNGERIWEPTVLEPGDRINIGGKVVTFCRVGTQLAQAAHEESDETVVFNGSPAEGDLQDVLRGDLKQIPLAAVLQILGEERKSGLVTVTTDNVVARLWLDGGRVIHAEGGRYHGMEAAMRMVLLGMGEFGFEGGASIPERSFDVSVTELLLESRRWYDESQSEATAAK